MLMFCADRGLRRTRATGGC